jgi:hypothetical protein
LLLEITDQLSKPLLRKRVIVVSRHPARLFKPPFQLFSVALVSHGDTHPNETAERRKRSILNYIFSFWSSVAIFRSRCQSSTAWLSASFFACSIAASSSTQFQRN